MKPQNLAMGALAGVPLVAPMIAIMYVADKWIDLSFPPFDVFDWIARILPGSVITFGIDLMIDALRLIGVSVADTAKTAEQAIAIALFLAGGVVATIVVFALVERWERLRTWPSLGFLFGAIAGIPVAIVTSYIAQSSVSQIWIFLWTLLLFLAWGGAAVRVAGRTLVTPRSTVAPGSEPGDSASVQMLGRRKFLIILGAPPPR